MWLHIFVVCLSFDVTCSLWSVHAVQIRHYLLCFIGFVIKSWEEHLFWLFDQLFIDILVWAGSVVLSRLYSPLIAKKDNLDFDENAFALPSKVKSPMLILW
jgi:hypothetical protein